MNEPGVLLLDDRRVFVGANDAAADLLGVARDELIGRHADEFMPVIARGLYPLAWRGFVFRGRASGDYAAQRPDGSLVRIAYVGFANRPIDGLHFFAIVPVAGAVDVEALAPTMQQSHIQFGSELDEDVRRRLVAEADRQEWRLPFASDPERAVVAAVFDSAQDALDVLDGLRALESVEMSVATAGASGTAGAGVTMLAGRIPYRVLGRAVEWVRDKGGRIVTRLDDLSASAATGDN